MENAELNTTEVDKWKTQSLTQHGERKRNHEKEENAVHNMTQDK